jgi:site-specific DNA-methyltransferase (adenine-specific)
MKEIEIILGDCLEELSRFPDNTFDMSFADPPFNLNKKYSKVSDKIDEEEYVSWCNQWLTEMVRVTNETGSIFVHNIPKWLTYYSSHLNKIANFRHWISWKAMGAPLGKTLLPVHYGILYYTKSKSGFKFYDLRCPHEKCKKCGEYARDYGGKKSQMHPYGTLMTDVWTDIHRIRHIKRRDEHPCQLPIPLLERLILMSTEEGDLVLDPFLGTGTTGIAAKKLGRRFVGIDIDDKYVEISRKKIDLASPVKLEDVYVSKYLGKIITLRDKDYEKIKDMIAFDNGSFNQLEIITYRDSK